MTISEFEDQIRHDLHYYLGSLGKLDKMLPDAPDIEELWEDLAGAYISDGIREYSAYPTVSLGWPMYLGMAIAKFWDTEWEYVSSNEDIYKYLRDQRGYDSMDDYICDEILQLTPDQHQSLNHIVAECASRIHSQLRHSEFEAGTKEAFQAYVSSIHQLYLMGAYIQLKDMGYRMTALNS